MDVPFPTDVQEFDSDERISFSKLDNKFIAVHDDGTEFEFDAELKKWVPAEEDPLDDELDELGEYGGTPADDEASNKKRKLGGENGDAVSCETSLMFAVSPATCGILMFSLFFSTRRTSEPPNPRVRARSRSLRRNPSRTPPCT